MPDAPGAGDPAALQAPGAHHYQGFAGAARSRSAGAVGRAAIGQRLSQPDHAGRRAETHHGAARGLTLGAAAGVAHPA